LLKIYREAIPKRKTHPDDSFANKKQFNQDELIQDKFNEYLNCEDNEMFPTWNYLGMTLLCH